MADRADPQPERLTAVVHGRVHGVGFRMFVRVQAARLQLSGYVRNRDDGTVEVAAEGPEARLRELEAAIRRGPELASVTRVDAERSPATGEFAGFQIRY